MSKNAKVVVSAVLLLIAAVVSIVTFGRSAPAPDAELEAHANAISQQLRGAEGPPPPPSLPPPERRGPRRGE